MARTKKAAKKKTAADPKQIAKRKQKSQIRGLFRRLGFAHIASDGKTFTFDGRTGEIDDIFVTSNVVVMCEYTTDNDTTAHASRKSHLYKNIYSNQSGWIVFLAANFPAFDEYRSSNGHTDEEYRASICYFSTKGVSDEIENAMKFVKFLDGTRLRYFESLTKAIHQSARYEFFKYLGLEFSEIGDSIKSTSTNSRQFSGHVLPESFSSFPPDFKVVSFNADPGTLLTMSYVLRRDSWRDPEGMYQRVISRAKMNQMRRYLTTEERVFVNNIIVTLPSETVLNDPAKNGRNLDPRELKKVRDATIVVPYRSDAIGIVDGQHRVYCYHEGSDKYETKIQPLRNRQNLLVTGIVYPENYSEAEKRRFEAKLFLEINDKQKRTSSDLRQSIELILNPYSAVAIAKSVISRLNSSGPLKGMLQTNYFDEAGLLKTTSIVSYGLKPLLKLEENSDSIFSIWENPNKKLLISFQKLEKTPKDNSILDDYVKFASEKINEILIAAKKQDRPERWRIPDNKRDRQISPTMINGFIVCLRLLIENDKTATTRTYEKHFDNLSAFNFKGYKSSQWKALGNRLFQTFFSK